MLHVTINGRQHTFDQPVTILQALNKIGIQLPALCDDARLAPIGACRLCVVDIGAARPVTACNTRILDGMRVETHSDVVETLRRTNLRLIAHAYPAQVIVEEPNHPFHRLLELYGVAAEARGILRKDLADTSHPYIDVDMSRCIYCYRCARICDEVQGQFVWHVWNRGDRTRILPDSETTLFESSCVSCGACADTCPTGAIRDKSSHHDAAPTQWTKTTCPYCGVGCQMLVGAKDNQITSIKPVINAAVNKGHLCVKGRYAFEFVRSNERITEPMIRRNGEFAKVSWPEAVTFVADNFKKILSKHGRNSVGVLGSARATNEENYLVQKFARVVLGTNNVDCCARVCHAPSAAAMRDMMGTGAATNSFDDIEAARTILLCGSNASENHPIVGARIKQARLHGTNLIVIDPRKIELAHYADLHLQLRPGTNVPLLNAMAHVIIEENLFDTSAVPNRVDGFEKFVTFIRRWAPEAAASVCGVDPELIRVAARLYAVETPSICFHGLGMTEHVQGTEGVMCLVNLALLTGNFGKPGTGINPLRGQNNVQGAAHMGCEPSNLTGYIPLEKGRQTVESVWGAPIPVEPGLNLMRMMDAAGKQMKGLWAIGYDIGLTNPDARVTRAALESLEFLVVQDMFETSVSRHATVFLPCASAFEKDGTFMNAERRVQRVRKIIEPPGNCRADWEIIAAVAGAMDKGKFFNFSNSEEIWNEIRQIWAAGAGITYQRIEEEGLQWPCVSNDHSGTSILHRDSFSHGSKGLLQLISWLPTDETRSAEYPFVLTTGRTLYQFNAGTMTMHTPDVVLRPTDLLDMAPEDAAALSLEDGGLVSVRSRHGKTQLRIQINPAMRQGTVFATFHTAEGFVNTLTGGNRDTRVDTPEYKVTAVQITKLGSVLSSVDSTLAPF